MKSTRTSLARRRARFTRRVVILESPDIVARLEAMADAVGHSLASEIRYAIRRWLTQYDEDR